MVQKQVPTFAAMFSTKLDKLWAKQMHINGIVDFKGGEETRGLRKRHDLKGICPYCALTTGMVGEAGLRKPLWNMAGPTRLELATSGVTGRRSNQLNYDPAGSKAVA